MTEAPPSTQREIIVRKVAEQFNKLTPDKKRKYVDDTLTALVNMPPKKMAKLFQKMVKKGRPSEKDLETVNQLIVVFLYSLKTEFRYHYATMLYKSLKMPLPQEIPMRLEQVRRFVFLSDIGVSPEVYSQLHSKWQAQGEPDYDTFITNLVNATTTSK